MASYSHHYSAGGSGIAKAGWLYRRSTILHRWKKHWFVLDTQGDLRYYDSPNSSKAEERIVVRAHVINVKAGPEARCSDTPEGVNTVSCGFMVLVLRDKDNLVLCSDTFDDMKAWQVAIEEARALPASNMTTPLSANMAGVPYVQYGSQLGYGTGLFSSGGYGGQIISTGGPMVMAPAYTQQVIQTPTRTTIVQTPPQQIVVMDDDPYRYNGRRNRNRQLSAHRGHFTWY